MAITVVYDLIDTTGATYNSAAEWHEVHGTCGSGSHSQEHYTSYELVADGTDTVRRTIVFNDAAARIAHQEGKRVNYDNEKQYVGTVVSVTES